MAGSEKVDVDGHRLTLTHLDKVLYPETGTTKGDVIAYYSEVAPYLIPHAADRPATRKRWVNGVGTDAKPGDVFFQKKMPPHSATETCRSHFRTRGRTINDVHGDSTIPQQR